MQTGAAAFRIVHQCTGSLEGSNLSLFYDSSAWSGSMSHDFDIQRFLKRAPRDWLQRYFGERGVLADCDWSSVGKRNVDPLYEVWRELEHETQQRLSEEFRNVQLLANPAGKLAILDEAKEVDDFDAVAEGLAELDDFYSCVFWTLLDRNNLWNGAIFFAAADSKPKRYWRKRINMPALDRSAGKGDAERLGRAVGQLFREKEARGGFCTCHQYRRGRKIYYFLYPQDHPQTPLEYDEHGQWTKRPRKFAFEIIVVHDADERTLNIWHDGPKDRVKDLQVLFAKQILGADIPLKSAKDDRVYDLSGFMEPDYQLKPPEGLGIKKASIRKIRVQHIGDRPHTIRIDLNRHCPDHVLYERLHAATRGLKLSMLQVTLVGIEATFDLYTDQKNSRPRMFEIAASNSCSLGNTPKDILLQRMLVENGIEPQLRAPADVDKQG